MIRVLRRQLSGGAWSLVLLALVVAALVALTVGWPRALDRLLRDDLVARTQALPATQRDLTLTIPQTLFDMPPPTGDAAEAGLERAAQWTTDQVADAGPALAAVLGTPQHEISRSPFYVDLGPHSTGISYMTLELSVGPRDQDLRLVEGSWPSVPDVQAWLESRADEDMAPLELDVVLTRETADWMGWRVGETRESLDPTNAPFRVRLSGLVEAADPASEVWDHLPGVLGPAINRDDNAGWTVHGVGYTDPSAVGALMIPNGVQLDAWYPVDPAAVGEVDRHALATELAGIRAATGLRTDLTSVLATAGGRERTATTLLGVLVAGLIGVAAGVLWLVSTLAVERRRAALVLLRARGASSVRLAALVGAQAMLAALPGAAVGLWAGLRVPGRTDPTDLVLPAALTLAAVGLMVGVAAAVHGGRRRRGGRWTWVVELLVLAATAVALTVTSASDPLIALLPVLVGLSAALVARRVYRWPAQLALRTVARRGDLGAFLGVARAARVPAAGLVPVLALTLGVATAGLAMTAVATMTQATERSAVQYVGADLRLDLAWSADGVGLREDRVAAAREVPGVAAITTVADAGTVTMRQDRTRTTVHLTVVDGDALATVQGDLPGGRTDLATGSDTVLVAPGLTTGDVTFDAPSGRLAVTAVASDQVPGVTSGTGWVLMDAATWADAGGTPPVDRLLVRLEPGADGDQVAAAIGEATGAKLTATTRAQAVAAIAEGVLVTGVRTAMLLVAAASLALVAVVLALLLVADAPARGRTAAMLATLGAPGRVHLRLVVAEVLGPVAVAGLAGVAAGLVLPSSVLRVADLRPFTGAIERPPIAVDVGLLLAAGAGLAVVVVIGIVVAAAAARRVSPVGVLREGAGG
jgi:putative ABC transport system permease protein